MKTETRINHYVLIDSQDSPVSNNGQGTAMLYQNPDIFYRGIELPTYSPVVHAVAHRKTFEEKYHARDYQELRGRR